MKLTNPPKLLFEEVKPSLYNKRNQKAENPELPGKLKRKLFL
jgi:hypothetical protein